jgi:protein TonB
MPECRSDQAATPAPRVSHPRLIREVVPTYTNAALQARIQGVVFMSAVVREDGSVGEVWITRSLDRTFGLDQEAIRTVKQWRFIPAMQAGKPVGVVVPIELQFTIR